MSFCESSRNSRVCWSPLPSTTSCVTSSVSLFPQVLHSTARYCKSILDDNSSSALIILGFVIMSPLIVAAMAIYCSVARRLRLFLCFQPYSRAVYKGVKWRWYEEGGLCSCAKGWNTQVKAWV